MKDIALSNVPAMTVGQAVDALSNAYCRVLEKGLPVKTVPSAMLWGPPGIGKSQAVRQIAENLRMSTGKTVQVTDVRLLLFNPIDLRGIPTANADKTLAIWLKPKIFQMDESSSVVNILFLDEISAAPPSVQAAAYQITLDRVVGEHRLPENCIVIAAGNRTTDKSVAYKMPKALCNRLLHIEIRGSFSAWKEWAVRKGIHEKVLGYLNFRKDALMGFDPGTDDLAFPTPRSWEMVSDLLLGVSDDVDTMYPMIAGLIGTGAAADFRTWARVYRELPDVKAIFAGEMPAPPHNPDALYALVSAMTGRARLYKNDLNAIANSIRYAEKLPPDFAAVLMKNYQYLDENYQQKLLTIPEYTRWMQTRGGMLNGTVR